MFERLRGTIDRARRRGRRHGLYLLLGSASMALLQQTGESLAGRVSHVEMHPLATPELESARRRIPPDMLWLRGGFPESLTAKDDQSSARWREDFIRTYLERDIPQLGPRIPAATLRRFWTMLAHLHGGLLNAAALSRSLGVDGKGLSRNKSIASRAARRLDRKARD